MVDDASGNRAGRLVELDRELLGEALAAAVDPAALAPGAMAAALAARPHLFSNSVVFLPRTHLDAMAAVVRAAHEVTSLPAFAEHALEHAPPIARVDHGPRGAFLGYDFHVGEQGPRLIEVNTNPGGAMLAVAQRRACRACCPEVAEAVGLDGHEDDLEAALVAMFREEWTRQRGEAPLRRVAIVDDEPEQQYLHPEFLLFRALFDRSGLDAVVLDPSQLEGGAEGLAAGGKPIDLVYNRVTDFDLSEPAHAVLREACLAGSAVVTPGPRAHALHADKRNLVLLGDRRRLADLGVPRATAELLAAAVPETVLLHEGNRDELWRDRRRWFFKPAGGFGGRAAYRGDKLTRSAWEDMALRPTVAQRVVQPGRTLVPVEGQEVSLKLDVRCFAYAGRVQLVVARLYQGQTTNFRTRGGGFAPVFPEVGPRG